MKIVKINRKQVQVNAQGGGAKAVEYRPSIKIIKGSASVNNLIKKVNNLKRKEFYYNSGTTRIKLSKSELLKTLKMSFDYWVMFVDDNIVTIYSYKKEPVVRIVKK